MIDLKNITFAHRGIHNNSYIPENSLKAFKRAIDKNIPIEIDVHILKD
jgi:glycerophosphoryl diester phosphodiesterase